MVSVAFSSGAHYSTNDSTQNPVGLHAKQARRNLGDFCQHPAEIAKVSYKLIMLAS